MLILIKADLNNTPSIVPMCPTRWTVKWAALNAIIANYVFLLLTFEQSFREQSKTYVLNFYPPKTCFRILISYLEF